MRTVARVFRCCAVTPPLRALTRPARAMGTVAASHEMRRRHSASRVTCRSLGERIDLSEDPEAGTGGRPAPRTDSAFALPPTYLPAHPMLIGSSSDDDDDVL